MLKGDGVGRLGANKVVLCALVVALLALGGVAGTASAAVPPVKGNVSYQLNNKPLTDFLTGFFASQGLGVVIDPDVKSRGGTLNGPLKGSARSVLDKVLRTNGLIAYYDGATVFIYTTAQRQTRFTSLPPAKVEAFAHAVADMQLLDDDDTISAEAGTGMVKMSGTPRFVDQMQKLANTVASSSAATTVTPTVFKYYPLKYALASDTTMTIGDRQITVPGVATLLRELVGTGSASSFSTAQDRLLTRRPGLRGRGLASAGQPPLPPMPGYGDNNGSSGMAMQDTSMNMRLATPAPGQPDVRIVADPYRNAVIVRDTPDRIPMYNALIKQLDVPSPMVEIEATIIDVDKDKLKRYGVNWYFRNSSGHASIGFNTEAPDVNGTTSLIEALLGDTIDRLLTVTGFQAGAIIGNSAKFIARVDALQSDGITDVITRPQVLTLNDVQSVIANTQTMYVPVQGSYSTDLYNVVAGTVLRVTPHVIVNSNGQRQIRLTVEIQDGNVTLTDDKYANLGSIPLVSNQAVNTQAVITPGQSLLLGGMVADRLTNKQDKIPILGDIPIIRNLFRHVEKEREHTERLFLITPKLVTANDITQQRVRSAENVSVEEIYNNQDKLSHKGHAWMGKPKQLPLPPQGPPPPPPQLQPRPAAPAPVPQTTHQAQPVRQAQPQPTHSAQPLPVNQAPPPARPTVAPNAQPARRAQPWPPYFPSNPAPNAESDTESANH